MARSAVETMQSLKKKIELYMNAGDATDYTAANYAKTGKGRPSWRGAELIQEETDVAIEKIYAGQSMASVARNMGLSPNALLQRLRSRGLSVKDVKAGKKGKLKGPAKKKPNPEHKEQDKLADKVRALYAEGHTVEKATQEVGLSLPRLRASLERRNLKLSR